MKKHIVTWSIMALLIVPAFAQNAIDIQRYQFAIGLSDDSDVIKGKATVILDFLESVGSFQLDLETQNTEGKGMKVSSVTEADKALKFSHKGSLLTITPQSESRLKQREFTITYEGIPQDGLIIGVNKHGERTFFGDNWPNRAHHWLPCVDHSSDKAFVEFMVTAPDVYQVIATGKLVEESSWDGSTFYHYKSEVPVPPKVVVIGVAKFAVQYLGEIEEVELSSWVYRQDRDNGFYDYAIAADIISYFVQRIGPFPFSKLANVQSKTRYGGMENAGNIFYSESSVSGERKIEGLFAHEIAHQWFGNSASESDWAHLWLSEGFASYMTNLYLEYRYGTERLAADMQKSRTRVLEFGRKQPLSVINATKEYMSLLNANSYQKGAWVLHMLRNDMGDEKFWEVIRTYYEKYQFSNATSADFQAVCESVSGTDYQQFFDQWLTVAGNPEVAIDYKPGKKSTSITLKQTQETLYVLPVEVLLTGLNGESKLIEVLLDQRSQDVTAKTDFKVQKIVLDPKTKLLVSSN